MKLFYSIVLAVLLSFTLVGYAEAAPRSITTEQTTLHNHGGCTMYAQVYRSTNPVTNISFSAAAAPCPTYSTIGVRAELYYRYIGSNTWTYISGVYKLTTGTHHYASSWYSSLCGGIDGNHVWRTVGIIYGSDYTTWVSSTTLYTYLQPC